MNNKIKWVILILVSLIIVVLSFILLNYIDTKLVGGLNCVGYCNSGLGYIWIVLPVVGFATVLIALITEIILKKEKHLYSY